jgi:uncharacterized damage-inducible protein DinB
MTDLRYPIGPLEDHMKGSTTAEEKADLMDEIEAAPAQLRAAVAGLDDAQLDTPYREDGWTVRQVVHHVFDSHVNAYVRFRWALTEDGPVIKPYEEKEWAKLPDAMTAPVAVSLDLLDALHTRWLLLLRAMTAEDFERPWSSPDFGEMSVDGLLQIYAWHGKHHVGHVTALRGREGW